MNISLMQIHGHGKSTRGEWYLAWLHALVNNRAWLLDYCEEVVSFRTRDLSGSADAITIIQPIRLKNLSLL